MKIEFSACQTPRSMYLSTCNSFCSYSAVLTELLPHPVYALKQMSPLSILGGKKLSLQYCLKLSCNYNNPAYAIVFNSKFHSVFERKPTQLPPLAIRVSGDLQAVGLKKE